MGRRSRTELDQLAKGIDHGAVNAFLERNDQLRELLGFDPFPVTEFGRIVRFQVDINTTDWPEMTLLPGIGETLARRIIASRDDQGPYLDHSELQRVRGIGPYTLERIRPHLRPIPAAQDMAGQ